MTTIRRFRPVTPRADRRRVVDAAWRAYVADGLDPRPHVDSDRDVERVRVRRQRLVEPAAGQVQRVARPQRDGLINILEGLGLAVRHGQNSVARPDPGHLGRTPVYDGAHAIGRPGLPISCKKKPQKWQSPR